MEQQTLTLSASPIQLLLALALQIWMIVFPIILIRKINYLTDLLHDHIDGHSDDANNS